MAPQVWGTLNYCPLNPRHMLQVGRAAQRSGSPSLDFPYWRDIRLLNPRHMLQVGRAAQRSGFPSLGDFELYGSSKVGGLPVPLLDSASCVYTG